VELKRISIDTSKHIFTIHGVDPQEHPVLRREIRRTQLESFFVKLEPTEVALEACAGSHHWGRLLSRMGHRVKLIPPQYVKPFVKRSKNDVMTRRRSVRQRLARRCAPCHSRPRRSRPPRSS